jgi:hypothetical protein
MYEVVVKIAVGIWMEALVALSRPYTNIAVTSRHKRDFFNRCIFSDMFLGR